MKDLTPNDPLDPDLSAPASTGDRLSLGRFLGKVPLAICFVPGLGDDGAAEVVRSFDQHLADFGRSRLQALVVAPASVVELDRFRGEHQGNVPVLADEEGAWARHFGVTPQARQVTTVLVGTDGAVAGVVRRATGGVHAEEVLAEADSMGLTA